MTSTLDRRVRSSSPGLLAGCLFSLLLAACSGGGGGGGGGSFESAGVLESISFPTGTSQPTVPPGDASLIQQVVFIFSASPNPDAVNNQTVRILDPGTGFPVPGSFEVDANVVTFTPNLPTREIVEIGSGVYDTGGAGLAPGRNYSIQIGPSTWSFIRRVSDELKAGYGDPSDPEGVFMTFTTSTAREDFLRGFPVETRVVTAASPTAGTVGVTPQLYTDPAGLFPPRQPFVLELDGPVNPSAANLDQVLLVDVDDTTLGAAGLPLGVDCTVVLNRADRSVIEVMPSGILPFGHLLSMEIPVDLRSISDERPSSSATSVVSTFTTATAPQTVEDVLAENFDATRRQEKDNTQIPVGQVPARWDSLNSNVLEAGFAFDGIGELGRFIPAPPEDTSEPRTIVLDTSTQSFPLLDGSTPDAVPGTVIQGGVFSFSSIDIPAGVIVDVRGPNPLMISCTGSVTIAGEIRLLGFDGTDDNAFDSAITSVPGGLGGAGGGRGGEGHPILFTGQVPTQTTLVSPPAGGRGFGPGNLARIGGEGGQSGIFDRPDENGNYGNTNEINCTEVTNDHNNGYKPPGGGGGSMLFAGTIAESDGRGNVLTDGLGGYIVRKKGEDAGWRNLAQGDPGQLPFPDSDPDNNFIGIRGERQTVFGGQGGGAGGSALDSYFCGDWCKFDANPFNDNLCIGEFGVPGSFAGSVGDARGGSAGGGGGAILLRALGPILMKNRGTIDASGGNGGGGEALGCGNWAGCGAGGSGGAVILQSADSIEIRRNARIDVAGGAGRLAVSSKDYITSCGARNKSNQGTAGDGSVGIIQLQVPFGSTATVENSGSLTADAWVDQDNDRNPAEFSPISVAQSIWYDMGRTIARPPANTNPVFAFAGTNAGGFVITDDDGNVLNSDSIDIRCDYLGQLDPVNPGTYLDGQEPRSNFIPPNATVQVLFQGADAITEGSKEVASGSLTGWVPDAASISGKQFLRYRIVFDITAGAGAELSPLTARPAVQEIGIRAEF